VWLNVILLKEKDMLHRLPLLWLEAHKMVMAMEMEYLTQVTGVLITLTQGAIKNLNSSSNDKSKIMRSGILSYHVSTKHIIIIATTRTKRITITTIPTITNLMA
jgi:xanthine dehydrogenase molybdopterin-binding subunit B